MNKNEAEDESKSRSCEKKRGSCELLVMKKKKKAFPMILTYDASSHYSYINGGNGLLAKHDGGESAFLLLTADEDEYLLPSP